MGKWRVLLLLAAIPAVLAQHAAPHDQDASPASLQRSGSAAARFERDMNAGMAKMMTGMHASGFTGNADVDFLAMMIPHHEGAVEMARLVLVHGRDPATRRLAEDIIASQTIEIEGMKRRLAGLRARERNEAEQFPALGGTRGPAR